VGFVVLFGLSALAMVAALAIASRARLPGRAQVLVAVTLLWNALIVLPIYTLGLLGFLTAGSLAAASVVVSLAAVGVAARGVGFSPLLRQSGRIAEGLLRLPVDALALCWRARSLVFVGVAFTAVLLPYLGLSAYLAQPLPHWDPLWYHDTMVGLTIQNHSFAMVDLPETLQKVNGYVRLAEMTQLWMVVFADRRLADLTNLLFAPALIAGTYVLARRHAGQLVSLGWGVAVVLMPTTAGLLHSTYVDPQYGALLLGGIVFATVDRPRVSDAWLASLGLALAIGSKGLALVSVPVVGVVGAWLFLRAHWHGRRRLAIATVIGGALLIVAVAATTYLRNYWAFHNPFWPDLRVDVPSLGIHWPGQGPWSAQSGGPTVNLNEPPLKLFDQWFALPWLIKNNPMYEQAAEYGIGITWIVFPFGVFAFGAAVVAAVRAALGRRSGSETRSATTVPAAERPPIAVMVIVVAIVAGSPAVWAARYHITGVALVTTLVAWLTGRPERERLGEAAVAASLIMSMMMIWWTPVPRWWYTPEQLVKLAKASPVEREVDRDLGAPTMRLAGLARERELGPGKLLVFNERYSGFPSIFWNRSFTSRIAYVRGGPDFLGRAARAGATWVYVNDGVNINLARAAGSGWQEVGPLNGINGGGLVFRRVPVTALPKASPPPPAPPAPPRAPLPPPAKSPAPAAPAPVKPGVPLAPARPSIPLQPMKPRPAAAAPGR
jgi:hypothetical protein